MVVSIFFPIAMLIEAVPLINYLNEKSEKTINGYKFILGKIGEKNIIIGISDIGLINTSGLMYVAFYNFNFDYVINYGTSGSMSKDIHKNDIIIVNECMNTGSYYTYKDDKSGEYLKEYVTFSSEEKEDKLIWYKADEYLLNVAKSIKSTSNVHIGRLGSADVWNKDPNQLIIYNNKFGILSEDMEGVSIYQISKNLNLKSILIKGISDNEILGEEYDIKSMEIVTNFILNFLEKL